MVDSSRSASHVRARRVGVPLVLLALSATACSGGSSSGGSGKPSAADLLKDAKQTIDATSAVHFAVTSANVTGAKGAYITNGTGDVVRPDGFRGTMTVAGGPLSGKVDVVSKGGKFYVQLPIVGSWTTVDPSKYGFGDPGKLLAPSGGISSLLTSAQRPAYGSQTRVNGEVVDVVHATLPAAQVGKVLTTADPNGSFSTTFDITPGSHQVRQVLMTGPFFVKGGKSSYTVTLTQYGENVTITPPP